MELHDLLAVDPSTLTAREAELVSHDAIRVLAAGGITGADQKPLRELVLECKRKTLPPPAPDTRQRVAKLIEEAESRGDKRTAQLLMDSMVKADVDALANEERQKQANAALEKVVADDEAAKHARLRKLADQYIEIRAEELLYSHGNKYGYDETKAWEEATREVLGRRQFQQLAEEA